MDFPGDSAGKESICNAGDLGSITGLGRCPAEGKGYLLQYPGLEKSMDCIVYGVTKSWTRLGNFDFHLIDGLPRSLIAQLVKNLPAMQETLVRFLGQEDLLEKG